MNLKGRVLNVRRGFHELLWRTVFFTSILIAPTANFAETSEDILQQTEVRRGKNAHCRKTDNRGEIKKTTAGEREEWEPREDSRRKTDGSHLFRVDSSGGCELPEFPRISSVLLYQLKRGKLN